MALYHVEGQVTLVVSVILAMDENKHVPRMHGDLYRIKEWEVFVDVFCGFNCFQACYRQLFMDFAGLVVSRWNRRAIRGMATETALPRWTKHGRVPPPPKKKRPSLSPMEWHFQEADTELQPDSGEITYINRYRQTITQSDGQLNFRVSLILKDLQQLLAAKNREVITEPPPLCAPEPEVAASNSASSSAAVPEAQRGQGGDDGPERKRPRGGGDDAVPGATLLNRRLNEMENIGQTIIQHLHSVVARVDRLEKQLLPSS